MLIFNLLLTGLASTSFIFIPVYKEYQEVPHAILYKNTPAEESEVAYTLVSVAWTLCDEQLSEGEVLSAISAKYRTYADKTSLDLCNASAANITSDIVEYLDCGDVSEEFQFGHASLLALANGTFCSISNAMAEAADTGHIRRCDISVEHHPSLQSCSSSSGSHSKTFWSYLLARSVYLWAKDSTFVLFDGTSLR